MRGVLSRRERCLLLPAQICFCFSSHSPEKSVSPLSFPVLSLWFHATLIFVRYCLGPKLSCVWVRVLIGVLTQERGPLSPSSRSRRQLVTPRGTISSATIYQLITIIDGLSDTRDRRDDRPRIGCRDSSFTTTFLPAFHCRMPGATF